jgi:hypothetical protein
MMKRPKLCLLVLLAFVAGIAVQAFWPLAQWQALGIKCLQRIRLGKSPSILAGKKNVMVAVTFGQSNAANNGETRHTAGPGVHYLFEGKLYPAADPIRGASGAGGSVWPRLGDGLMKEGNYDTVVFRCCAANGSSVAQWEPGGNLHQRLLDAIRDCQQSGLKITHLLWHQGEADSLAGTADYPRHFLAMLQAIRAEGVDAPIYVSVASSVVRLTPSPIIREAQQSLANSQAGILPGPDSDQLGEPFRYEGVHFSSDGLDRLSDLWLHAISPRTKPTR